MATRLISARLRTLVGALCVGLALTTGIPAPAHASVSATPTPTTSLGGDAVFDLAVLDSGRVVLGGDITSIGKYPRQNLAALLPTGKPDLGFAPTTNGEVRAVTASEDGTRIFIGGTFTQVDGVPRQNLAAIDAVTGALISGWQADTTGTAPTVTSLDVSGGTLYVGGKFTGIDGSGRQRIAAVDVTSGDLRSWEPSLNGNVKELRVSPDGSTLWVGGPFTRVNGIARAGLAGISTTTGNPNGFNRSTSGSMVITVAVSDDGQWLYASTETNYLFAFRPSVSSSAVWSTRLNGNVQAIAVSPTEIYIGGHFTQFANGLARRSLASVNAANGTATTWNPKATGLLGGGWSLVIKGGYLHAGGQFTHFDGVQQRLYARFPGTPTP